MANDGTHLLVRGNSYYGDPIIQRFTASGGTSTLYMDHFPGLGDTSYDTAWIPGGIWIARDNPDSPILAYDTDGLLVGHVDGSTVGAAMGLTMDTEGYLWASDPETDTIYQLDVSTHTAESPATPGERVLRADRNPFAASVLVTGNGFTEASLEIFDVSGRRVHSADFPGSYTWNATGMPSGAYFMIVTDDRGSEILRLTRIR